MDSYRKVIGKAIRFMEDNLKEDISVEDIARESAYSLSHFTRVFMELTGETPGVYLRKRRLERAARELLEGKRILDTALDYHFGSQEAFTRSFKSHFNVPPGFYVKLGADMSAGILNGLKEVEMKKQLESLRWPGRWNTHLGCIKGCLDYLKLDVSDAWLYGATGYAFIMNMRDIVVCGSSPNTWNKLRSLELGENTGYESDSVFALNTQEDFDDKLREAWDLIRESVDRGMPCYGWEVGYPGYQVIIGYDDAGYYYSGPDESGGGHKPWQQLGDTVLTVGMIEMYNVKPGQAADDTTTVKKALEFALEHAEGPEKWIFPNYRAGLAGWDMWIETVDNGTAEAEGMAYNAAFWTECRGSGAQFLREAGERLNGKVSTLLKDAAERYGIVYEQLERVAELFPYPVENEVNDEESRSKAVTHLRNARNSEEAGLELLAKIVEAI